MDTMRERQWVLAGTLALSGLLAGAALGGWAMWRLGRQQMADADFLRRQLELVSPDQSKSAAATPLALVRIATAQSKTVEPSRPIVGRLVEVRKATVTSEVAGMIVEMDVEEGSRLSAGKTVVARIDDVWCRLALARSRAVADATEAKLHYELLELDRSKDLRNRNAIAQSELESKEATVAALKAELAEAKAAIDEENQRLARSVIRAPFDGTVISKFAELGQHVAVGTPVVEIVSRDQIDARLTVPESAVNLIHVGQELPVRIDATGDEVRGKVVSVTPYGPTASRTFPVRVRLDDQQGRLKAGMSVSAFVVSGPKREALVVTKDAVLVRPDGAMVWGVSAGSAQADQAQVHPIPVEVTVRMRDEYAIQPETDAGRKLLRDKALVVIEGAERLTAGQQVRIVRREQAAGVAAQEPRPEVARQEN